MLHPVGVPAAEAAGGTGGAGPVPPAGGRMTHRMMHRALPSVSRRWLLMGLPVLLLPAAAGEASPTGSPSDPRAMTFVARDTGFAAGEPTLGTLKDGSIIYQALTDTLKSSDEGLTWKLVHQPPTGTITFDPYVHVDAATDRIVASQLFGACQLLSISTDSGTTWMDAPTQCGTGDHQKLGSGPWAPAITAPLHPSAFYTCVNHIADTACAASPDGGLTWGPLVTVFAGVDPTATEGIGGISGFCGGLEGDPAVGPDGTVYLPREYCGRPFLGVSTDNGLTWTQHRVGGADSLARPIGYGANNPSVAIGKDGDVYYAWTDGTYGHRVARSGDKGATWTQVVVSTPDMTSSTFPFVVAGDDGRVVTGFVAAKGGRAGNPGDVGKDAVWHLYLAFADDADAATPTFDLVQATPADDPVMRGCIARHGGCTGPGTQGHDSLLDFNDVALLPDGRLVVSYVDACLPEVCKDSATSNADRGYLLVQTGGPTLLAPR